MRTVSTPAIPIEQEYINIFGAPNDLDLKAIATFIASNFFFDEDTWFNNRKVLRPGHTYSLDDQDNIIKKEKTFNWFYEPEERSLDLIIDEFSQIFENIVSRETFEKKIVLPISGGLDSRSLVCALNGSTNVFSYTYEFENGTKENSIGKAVANAAGLEHSAHTIKSGYLWDIISDAAEINSCYSDFTSARQLAIIDEIKDKGDVFLLGHWGDVLFDSMGQAETLDEDQAVEVIKKKMLNPAGLELAQKLWEHWQLPDSVLDYLEGKIREILSGIQIDNANAKIRAFKSMTWAPRWTSSGVDLFKHYLPVSVPYYDDEMCRFICRTPEKFLADRKIQIEYIKRKNRKIAEIPWQKFDPCNLYNYEQYYSFNYLPIRAWRKMRSLNGKSRIKRNWELQFFGEENEEKLRSYLFDNKRLVEYISMDILLEFYEKFKENPLRYAQSISMLLTFSVFLIKWQEGKFD